MTHQEKRSPPHSRALREFHEEIAVAALEAGRHVYLAKLLAITVEGCNRILEAAYRSGKKLMIGHNMRYMDFVLKMKEIIDSGIIGEIESAWCRHFICYGNCYFRHFCAEQKSCTGLLPQKGSHDIIHWLTGGYTDTTRCATATCRPTCRRFPKN